MSTTPATQTRYPVEKDREFRCPTCGARCTRTLNSGEVGHKYRCPRRPDRLPQGGGSGGGSYYEPSEEVTA
jgi:predicted RNA-binding Zn-ribbon protein involved in translation (DUF1610 family)